MYVSSYSIYILHAQRNTEKNISVLRNIATQLLIVQVYCVFSQGKLGNAALYVLQMGN